MSEKSRLDEKKRLLRFLVSSLGLMSLEACLMANAYAYKARTEKAIKLSDLANAWKIRSYDVAGFSESSWGMLADAARVKRPSEETQHLVIQMLRDRELAGAAALERDRR